MATAEARRSAPSSTDELAAELAGAARDGVRVRLLGAGTKRRWAPDAEPGLELSSAGLDRIVEHNAGDLTAVLEAGVPLARAQERFREAGQMLALDPPDAGGATIGGIVATNDSGPLKTRYGGARDLVVGMRVALADGTVAKSGGKVIKNVAGYDLAKLFTGSHGTLGAILEVSVRLHPLPPGDGHSRRPHAQPAPAGWRRRGAVARTTRADGPGRALGRRCGHGARALRRRVGAGAGGDRGAAAARGRARGGARRGRRAALAGPARGSAIPCRGS